MSQEVKPKNPRLSPKHRKFVASILKGKTEAQAAIDAGYGKGGAHVTGCRLLKNAKIIAALETVDQKAEEKAIVDAAFILSSLKYIATRCMQNKKIYDPSGQVIEEYKFDPGGANKALELLGKHVKLFTDKIEHSGKVSIADFIQDAYKAKDEAQKQE